MAIQDDKNMPKSRVTLRYRTQINGVPEDITLPLRLLILGDFSGMGSDPKRIVGQIDSDSKQRLSLDKRTTFDASQITDVTMHDEMGNKLTEAEYYNPVMKQLNIKSGDGSDEITISQLDDFAPDKILANSKNETKNELHIKQLLGEVKANLANNKRYRQAMEKTLVSDDNKLPAPNPDDKPSGLAEDLQTLLRAYQLQTKLPAGE